jgi:murein L,D-transpeptidase YafK
MKAIPQRRSCSAAAIVTAALVMPATLAAQELGGNGASRPLGVPVEISPPVASAAASAPVAGAAVRFGDQQLLFPRVRRAYDHRALEVHELFQAQGVEDPAEVFFRVFKREQLVEVWARDAAARAFVLINTYPMCGTSGSLGPKAEQGDEQIPEGFYFIDLFNPWSQYHLSLRVDYPNAVDRARGDGRSLGGDIFVHGGCATIGCVPVTDQWIEQLYLMALAARDAGQQRVPIHMFPTRLDDDGFGWLEETYGPDHPHLAFWRDLRIGYDAFERSRVPPRAHHHNGRYTFPLGVAEEQ